MSIQGTPASYRRGYSFTRHSVDRPTVPQPGDRLDQELDDIATVLGERAGALNLLVDATGALRHGLVGREQLEAGLFDEITTDAIAALTPLSEGATMAADRAQRAATRAGSFAEAVQRSADVASAAAHAAEVKSSQAGALWSQIAQAAVAVDQDEALAANSADTAEAFMVQAEAARDMSQQWAEYLAGPVQPAPPGWPEAIDDGMWSAKWWAVRASELVGTWGNWYIGASATPPVPPSSGAFQPGTLYFNTTTGLMMVWDGLQWHVLTTPVPAGSTSYVYVATVGQTVFVGPDSNGNTPALASATTPSTVFLNGVRLVRDRGNGTGDFTIDYALSKVTLKVGVPAGSVLHWDVLIDSATVAPGAVNAYKLVDIDRDPATGTPGQIDGVRATFPLRYIFPGDGSTRPAAPGTGVQLQVTLDGVLQEAGVDYTTAGTNVTFTTAPILSTRFSGVWYQPGA